MGYVSTNSALNSAQDGLFTTIPPLLRSVVSGGGPSYIEYGPSSSIKVGYSEDPEAALVDELTRAVISLQDDAAAFNRQPSVEVTVQALKRAVIRASARARK